MAIKVNNKLQMSEVPTPFDIKQLEEIAKQYFPFEEENTLRNIKMALTPDNFGEDAEEMIKQYGEDPIGFLDDYGYAMGSHADTVDASGYDFEDWAAQNVPYYKQLVEQFDNYAEQQEGYNYGSLAQYMANEFIYPYHQNLIKETRDPKSPRRAEILQKFKGLK